jgi:hypothetical protein
MALWFFTHSKDKGHGQKHHYKKITQCAVLYVVMKRKNILP